MSNEIQAIVVDVIYLGMTITEGSYFDYNYNLVIVVFFILILFNDSALFYHLYYSLYFGPQKGPY